MSDPDSITLNLSGNFCLADGIAKSIFLVGISVCIQIGAIYKIYLPVHPNGQITSTRFFDLELAECMDD